MQKHRNKRQATERPTQEQAHSPPAQKRKATREYPEWLVILLIFVVEHVGGLMLDALINKGIACIPIVIEAVVRLTLLT
jgi:hypothetical protein